MAREIPDRPVNPAQPPVGNPVAQANPVPAAQPDGVQVAPPVADAVAVEPPKTTDPIVSAKEYLKRLHSWGPQLNIRNFALSADGKVLAGTRENRVGLWKDPSGDPTASWPLQSVRFISVSPDGEHVTVGNTTAFAVHRVEDGVQVWEGQSRNPRPGALWSPMAAALRPSSPVTVSTCGRPPATRSGTHVCRV